MSKFHREVLSWLRTAGAKDARVEYPSRGHPRVRFTWHGHEVDRVISNTPSDRSAAEAAIRTLRRMMRDIDADATVPSR